MTDMVVVLHQQGHQQQQTFPKTGFSQFYIQKLNNKVHTSKEKCSGISRNTLCILKVISIKDRKKSSQMLAQHLAELSGTKVNISTRKGSLIKNGLQGGLQLRNHFCRKAKQK